MDTDSAPDHVPDHPLAGRLADQAARLDVGAPMLEVVMQRGRQRQQRRRTAVGLMAVACVCAATIVSINVLSRPTDHGHAVTAPVVDDSTPGDIPTSTGASSGASTTAHLVDSTLVWNRVDPDAAEALSLFSGYNTDRIAGDGPFVAWSTAPGPATGQQSDYQPVLWRSDDGQSWQQVAGVQLGSLASVAERDGRFIAYGTTPAESASTGNGPDLALATSDDGGVTWATQHLPVDTSNLIDEPLIASVSVSASDLAAGPNGVLALARVSVVLDPSQLPPAASTYGYSITSTGIEVYQPAPCATSDATVTTFTAGAPDATVTTFTAGTPGATCPPPSGASTTAPADTIVSDPTSTVVATTVVVPAGANTPATVPMAATTLTWAELGMSDEAVAALSSQLRVYFSADGSTFTEVQAPPTGDTASFWDARVTQFDGGFVTAITTYGYGATGQVSGELFQTSDGTSWASIGPGPIVNPDTFESMGDRLVMSGGSPSSTNPNDSMIAVRDAGGTWTTIDVKDLKLPSDGVLTTLFRSGLAVGPSGITMLATLYVDPVAEVGGVDVTRDGITMHADDSSGNFRFIDEAGTELGRVTGYGTSSALIAIDQNAGKYVVRRSAGGDVAATFTSQDYVEAMSSTGVVAPTVYVLHSTDGVNWSRESLTDLAGATVTGTGGVRVTDTQIIVAANLDERNPNGTAKQTLLIGTPAG